MLLYITQPLEIMGQQHRKIVKRRRRVAYIARKKEKLANAHLKFKAGRPRTTKKAETPELVATN